ncbi:hypothetical protein [Methanopyrus sp.]
MASRRYRYIGPCRCGLGPHAFYEDTETGEIKHAWQVLSEGGAPVPAWPGGGGWWRGGRRGGPGWGGGWWWMLTTADEETRKRVLDAVREAFGEDFAKALEKLAESTPQETSKEELEELRKKLEELEKRLREMEEKE